MKKLLIGQFSESFPPLMDGVGLVAKNYTEGLRLKGHDAFAIVSGCSLKEGTSFDKEQQIEYTLRSPMLPLPGIKPYGVVVNNRAFRKKVRQLELDLIHTHTPFFFGRFAEQLKRRSHIPLVTTFHSLYKEDFYGTTHSHLLSEHLTRMILKHYEIADEVWTPTYWSAQKLSEYGFTKEIIVVENGCDLTIPTETEYQRLRQEGLALLHHDKSTPLLLYIGQIKKEKNLDLTLTSLAFLKAKKVPFKMLFIGTGADMRYFVQRTEELDLTQQVTFMGRVSDREVIKKCLAAATLFLFPSQYDTSALVLREAAAYALPLVNSVGSSTAWQTTDGVNGFIAKNNGRDYGEKVASLLQNPKIIEQVGKGAQKSLYRHWSDVIEEVEMRYYTLLKRY